MRKPRDRQRKLGSLSCVPEAVEEDQDELAGVARDQAEEHPRGRPHAGVQQTAARFAPSAHMLRAEPILRGAQLAVDELLTDWDFGGVAFSAFRADHATGNCYRMFRILGAKTNTAKY